MNLKPLALIGTLALVLGGCGKNRELDYKNVQIKELERQNAELEAQLAAAQAGGPAAPIPTGDGTLPGGQGWTSSAVDKDISISISNEILFKPGSAVLTDKAKKVLDEVVSKIKSSYPEASIRVEGHTDDQIIKRSKDENKDNWDLSGNRSQAVLHYLLDHGIAEKKLGFAGYGMQRPLTSNSTADGKAKNRRVEILVITNK